MRAKTDEKENNFRFIVCPQEELPFCNNNITSALCISWAVRACLPA